MQTDLMSSLAISLALDESTDRYIQDNPQLSVFVCSVSRDMIVKEEHLDLRVLKESTRGSDIKNALGSALAKAHVPLDRLVSVATDGALAMVGKNAGLIGLMKKDPDFPEFLPVHCISHREHLVAKYFNYEESTRGSDIKNALGSALAKAHVPLDRLVSVATDARASGKF
ncbi:general transcription factor II-I repeat domain-containing protein 2-like [Styela clava]